MALRNKTGQETHCTFQVCWAASRKRYEVHGDDGELYGFSHDRHTAITIAQLEARHAEREGRTATICIEQRGGTYKTASHF